LPERNSGVGLRTGSVPAVGFIVRTDLSINATVFPLLFARANAELCPVVSFCLLLAHAQWYLAGYLPKPISVNTTRSSDNPPFKMVRSPRCCRSIPHRQRFLPLPTL
jgi:hypothetical protein